MRHLSTTLALALALSAGTLSAGALSTPAFAAPAAESGQGSTADAVPPLSIPFDSELVSVGKTGMLTHTGIGHDTPFRWTRFSDGVTTVLPPARFYWGSAGTDFVVSQKGDVFTLTDMSGTKAPVVFDTSTFDTGPNSYGVSRVVGESLLMVADVNEKPEYRLVSLDEKGQVRNQKLDLPAGSRPGHSYSSGPDSLAVTYTLREPSFHYRLSTVDVATGAITSSRVLPSDHNSDAIAVTPDHLTWVLRPYDPDPELQVISRATDTPVSTTPLITWETGGLTVHHVGDWVMLVNPGGATAEYLSPYFPLTARPLKGGAPDVRLLDHAGSVAHAPDGGLLALGGTLAQGEGLYRIAQDPDTGSPTVTLLRTFNRPTALTVTKENLLPTGTIDLDRLGGKPIASWTLNRYNARTRLTLTHTASGQTAEMDQGPYVTHVPGFPQFFTWNGAFKSRLQAYNGAYTWKMRAEPVNGLGPAVERQGSFTLTRAPKAHDFDDNGAPDVLSVDRRGELASYDVRKMWRLDSIPPSEYHSQTPYRRLIGGGWGVYDKVLAAGDLGGARQDDLVARDRTGVLWFYEGKSGHKTPFATRTRIGGGWGIYNQITAGSDLTGDGRADLVASDKAGVLWLYRGTGNPKAPFAVRKKISGGWGVYNQIIATGNLGGAGAGDLVARDKAGVLWLHLGKGDGTFTARTRIGSGWGSFSHLVAIGDVDADGRRDLLASSRDSDGRTLLRLYRGTGQWRTPFAYGQLDHVRNRPTLDNLF
ncbi:FG-GAP repeat domain-containing protein [Streptomyces sp. NPDC004435]|uniref:FG-GAP repeat domain-containing protein n=1 Tax=Streptomyces sp. NPDC004435 TaxID=3364701 RepID=UPI0036B9D930